MITRMANPSRNRLFAGNTGISAISAPVFALVFIMASVPNPAWSQGALDDEADAKEKAVADAAWQLPPPPLPDDLLPFHISRITGQTFAIDAKSLTVDTDGVIRYTMVSTSPSGAKNISYEGIRCSSHEKRLYASGHADGTWGRARISDWQPIAVKGTNLQHAALADDYLCADGLIAGKADKILDAIRHQRPRSPH